MILILSNKWDVTVDFVVAELQSRGVEFLRVNTEDLVAGCATVILPNFKIKISKGDKVYDLVEKINVIWNRRPGKPFDDIDKKERPSGAVQSFVNDQWYTWLEAIQLISNITWVNDPKANDATENKIRQLLTASKIGFEIPETVITNDPDHAKFLINKHNNLAVTKALYSPLIEEPEEDFFIFTNKIREINHVPEKEIRISPTIFQQALIPKFDYRVTVIGEKVFTVRIERQDGVPLDIDWRMDKSDINFIQCDLPPEIEKLCLRYVQESSLLFGAIDLVEHKDNFYFLEINPNGEWGWLQKPHNVPIAEALCDLLIYHDNKA